MKFEANIPSYLRTGAGVFPVKEKSMPKRIESTNFYEMAKQGFNMPIANDTNRPAFAPVGDIKSKEPMDAENFLDKMQDSMQSGTGEADIMPNPDVNLDAKPVMPELPLRKITPPKELVAGKKPLPGQQTLPGDFPTTGELNDREAADRYNNDNDDDDKVKEIDIFIS